MSYDTTHPQVAATVQARFHRLLVADDGSEHAALALAEAVALAQRDHATITLLSVAPRVRETIAAGPASAHLPNLQADVDEAVQGILRAAADEVPRDVSVTERFRRGRAGPEIVAQIHEGDYDAVVLGARGVGRIASLVGSVSQHVLRHADIAVLVAHAPRATAAPGPQGNGQHHMIERTATQNGQYEAAGAATRPETASLGPDPEPLDTERFQRLLRADEARSGKPPIVGAPDGAPSDQLVDEIQSRLRRIDSLAVRPVVGIAEELQLPLADLRLLLMLATNEGATDASELSERSGFSLDAVFPVLQRLRGRGYSREERRRHSLTETGHELVRELDNARRAGIRAYLSALRPDERLQVESALDLRQT